jgi:hypothetical protein
MRTETCGGVIKVQIIMVYGMLAPVQRRLISPRSISKHSTKGEKLDSDSPESAISVFAGRFATPNSVPKHQRQRPVSHAAEQWGMSESAGDLMEYCIVRFLECLDVIKASQKVLDCFAEAK